ncbi:MAG: hypothetical protein ACRDTE_28435 [Pseudonocardiaceae bacterium]
MTGPTHAELAGVVRLVIEHQSVLVNVGYGREARSVACANAFIDVWQAGGGEIGAIVSWPVAAASWLRPACRFAAGAPDAWVVADCAAGWAGFGPRLAAAGAWRARRTVAFSDLADPVLPELAGVEATDGIRGAAVDGSLWAFIQGSLVAPVHSNAPWVSRSD